MDSTEAINLLIDHLKHLRSREEVYLRDPTHTNAESSMMRELSKEMAQTIADIFVLKCGIQAAVRIKEKTMAIAGGGGQATRVT